MDTTQVLTNIVAYAVQIGLLVGIAAALPAILRLKWPGARLLYWQVLLIACLALPWVRPWRSEVIALSDASAVIKQVATPLVVSAPQRSMMPPIASIVLSLLAAGTAIRLIWLALGLLKLARYRRHGRALALPAEWLGLARSARLLVSEEISGPVTFGFFRPVVLLPAGFPAMPQAMRDAILFHELLHVERRDWLFTFGEELLRAVFWFHPAIWWVLGEIQLAREQTVDQAVIDMTQARDPYVDTLLAMAGGLAHDKTPQLDLAPAPLFLRRRHLKQRVLGIVQEVGMPKTKMSKTRLIFAQAAALAMLAAGCWFITEAIPLHAQAQMVADGPGVTVSLNGSQLMHRTPVSYPAEALAKGVEGTVVVQVRLDASGEVIDDAVLSGPDELRKSVQQNVLNWHFDKSAGAATRVVNIDFVKPANTLTPSNALIVRSPDAVPERTTTQVRVTPAPMQQAAPRSGTIDRIDVTGLSDSAAAELLARFPLHSGDPFNKDTMTRAADAARQFDSHLSVTTTSEPSGLNVMSIRPQQGAAVFQPMGLSSSPGAQKIGGNVMAASLISQVRPIYPPLAKMARQQGTVRFQATIGKDGTVEDLQLLSGPPLLVQASLDAVKNWVYKPTILNGAPVEVVTTVDVNFSLSEGPAPEPAQ
jgi:TonB family protein